MEKYLLQQILLLGRLDYRTTFEGAAIFPDSRSQQRLSSSQTPRLSRPAPKGMD